jgi:hypothetical protein
MADTKRHLKIPITQLRAEADEEHFIRELVFKHGGAFHGPHVEHLSIPESKFFAMMRDFRRLAKTRYERRLRFYRNNPDKYPTRAASSR